MPKPHIKHDYKHTQQKSKQKSKILKNKLLKPTFLIPSVILISIIFTISYKNNSHKKTQATNINKITHTNSHQTPTKTYDLQISG
jgi:hypothetical protein